MNRFKELKVWQESMNVVMEVYKLAASFPNDEKFNLTSQIKRSAVSIPSNIAEGACRLR
jgi:four helix bundle protein